MIILVNGLINCMNFADSELFNPAINNKIARFSGYFIVRILGKIIVEITHT